MARRTGIPTLEGLAIALCKALAKFTPIISALYPSNAALLAALAAANAACGVLAAELEQVRDRGT